MWHHVDRIVQCSMFKLCGWLTSGLLYPTVGTLPVSTINNWWWLWNYHCCHRVKFSRRCCCGRRCCCYFSRWNKYHISDWLIILCVYIVPFVLPSLLVLFWRSMVIKSVKAIVFFFHRRSFVLLFSFEFRKIGRTFFNLIIRQNLSFFYNYFRLFSCS